MLRLHRALLRQADFRWAEQSALCVSGDKSREWRENTHQLWHPPDAVAHFVGKQFDRRTPTPIG